MRHRRAVSAGALLTLVVAAPAVASHIQPEVVDGAQSCGPLAEGTVELVIQLPQDVGTIEEGDFTIDIALDESIAQGSLSFSNASLPVKAAFLAGPDGGNLYSYGEAVTEDDGLVAPDGSPIQDVSFCYVGGEDSSGGGGEAAPSGEASPEATGEAGGDGGTTPPQTDTAPAADPDGTGLILMTLGGVSLAAGLLLFLGQGRRPASSRRR